MITNKDFMLNVTTLIKILDSSHPSDKLVVKELVGNGMDKKEILEFKELLLKTAQACYGQVSKRH